MFCRSIGCWPSPEEVQHAKDRLDDAQATETTIHAELVAVGE
ncbi:MAG TPA: hypothetical protein VMY42_00285 [Thermoguttaceae bacterium]|nr:hypothetical protein [Thermoguttaceae bacterium]